MSNNVLAGVMGLVVADALGVPVEFKDRESLRINPVVSMRAFGTYNQPAGTWSDDSSMTLALLESLENGLDYKDIMDRFMDWYEEGDYTPYGQMFDIGIATSQALGRYKSGASPLEAGGTSEYDNGNGSLMRILPILFYLQAKYGDDFVENDEAFDIIHNISALTHRHKRSQMACGIYISIASSIMTGMGLNYAVESGIYGAMKYYKNKKEFKDELDCFSRLENQNFKDLPEGEIKSGGYVVNTLEASIWCLLNTDNYKFCVLKAVNLGKDTDTTGAVAGGLAGLRYGYENIPKEWLKTIARKDYIEDMCNNLYNNLSKSSAAKLLLYIPYFERARGEDASSWTSREETEGALTFSKFIDDFHQTNLMDYEYLDTINTVVAYMKEVDKYIVDADLELLKAILTGYIRQERFNEGLWERAVEENIFLSILYRLKELL